MYVNASAKRIFDQDDGLQLTSAGVQINDSNIQKNFTILLPQPFRDNVPLSAKAGGVLRIPRPSGGAAYTVSIAPMNDRNVDLKSNGVAAVVFLHDPNKRQISTVHALIDSYGLTNVEAELATSLMHGKTLDECAIERGVSYNTMKTHLHSLFMKTGTNRQAGLVSLLLRSIVGLNLKN
jgi:DNA-binding CsgD family transcriptional regulator